MPTRSLAWLRLRPASFWLVLVAMGYAVGQLVLVPLDMYLGWDEALYASQFSTSVREMGMSAHRSPGMPLVLAPVTLVTASTVAIRGYLTVVTTLGLFLAFRSWVGVSARAAPLGALLFAVSAVALVHANQVLPNVLTTLAAVAAVGCFATAGQPDGRGWRPLAGVVVAFAVASLLRPTDAVFVAAPLLAATVLVRRWRRLYLAAAVVAGLGVGGIAWLAEALARYGGPFGRLSALRSTTQAGNDPVGLQILSRLADDASRQPVVAVLVVVGVLAGIVGAALLVRYACGGAPAPVWPLAVVTAAVIGLPYYLLLPFHSDRYLLPTYGLLAMVAAAAIHRLVVTWKGQVRAVVSVAAIAAVGWYAVDQFDAATADARALTGVREARAGYAERLDALGIGPPCVVNGVQAPAFAYTLGCTAEDIISPVPNVDAHRQAVQRDQATARRENGKLVVVLYGEEPPERVADWRRVRLEERRPAYAYFPPGQS